VFFFSPTKINNHCLPSFLAVPQQYQSNLGHLRSVDLVDQMPGNHSKQAYEVVGGEFEVGFCVFEVAPQETGTGDLREVQEIEKIEVREPVFS